MENNDVPSKIGTILQEIAEFMYKVQAGGEPIGLSEEHLQSATAIFAAACLEVAYKNKKENLPDSEAFGNQLHQYVLDFTGYDTKAAAAGTDGESESA